MADWLSSDFGPDSHLWLLFLAVLADGLIGDPDWLWRRLPHPVVWIGGIINRFDTKLNDDRLTPNSRRARGILTLVCLVTGAGLLGLALTYGLAETPHGWLAEVAIVGVFLAQRSLYEHVKAVYSGLKDSGLAGGRLAVSRIVGRDPESLDEAGICRAAIESLAENFSDGIVAPLFWYAVAGLPGLLIYKAVNTADSMIGHKTPRHREFGWAAARFDDLINLPASRLTAALIFLSALALGKPWGALRAVLQDARLHRSPNAGWPEAAMAGALGLALAGPRQYGSEKVDDVWMNRGGRQKATAADINRALRVYLGALVIQAGLVLALAWWEL
ncbi:adenosylcobinamide-phosphate synthase CbiB [Rhodovibrionaceae bacterium A322]